MPDKPMTQEEAQRAVDLGADIPPPEQPTTQPPPDGIPDCCNNDAPPMLKLLADQRQVIGTVAADVLLLKKHYEFNTPEKFESQGSEMIANIMLAYRHLEDARMRLGKVAQYLDDGVSCYDKGVKPSC